MGRGRWGFVAARVLVIAFADGLHTNTAILRQFCQHGWQAHGALPGQAGTLWKRPSRLATLPALMRTARAFGAGSSFAWRAFLRLHRDGGFRESFARFDGC